MPGRGNIISSRTYWTTTDAKGKQVVVDTPPAGPQRPFGIGSTAPPATQYQEQVYEDGTKILSRWDPEAAEWKQESVTVDRGLQSQANQARQEERSAATAATTAATRDAATAETARHNRSTEAAAANTAARQDRRDAQQTAVQRQQATNEGRRIDLAQAAQDAENKWRQLNAEVAAGNLTLAQRNQQFKEYQTGVENQIAQQHLALQQQAQASTAANQGRQASLGEAEFGRGVGRDAVSAADKAYGYRREQAYARARAAGKSPQDAMNESAQTEIPDFDTIAEAAAQRAVQGLRGLAGAPPPTPVGATPSPVAGAAPSGVLASQSLTPPTNSGYPDPTVDQAGGRFGR